jgi:hypothetical protein
MKTLLLDRDQWDLVLDSFGNIALAGNPYSIAQDVASAIKTFQGEVWYDKQLGIPHFEQILGHWPPIPLVKSLITEQALGVPEVAQAQVIVTGLKGRTLAGQVQVIDTAGQVQGVTF